MNKTLYHTALYTGAIIGTLALTGCGKNKDLNEQYRAAEARCVPDDVSGVTYEYQEQLFKEFLLKSALVIGDAETYRHFNQRQLNFDEAMDNEALRHRSTGKRPTKHELSTMIAKLCPRMGDELKK